MKKVMKNCLSIGISVLLCIVFTVSPAQAATTISYAPKPQIDYTYQTSVKSGIVRYISQNPNSKYFQTDYWGSWANQAKSECFTSSISMALSYVGVNRTPKDILDYGKGKTYFGVCWDGINYAKPSFENAMKNYLGGNGKYSPPIIHLSGGYASGSHYVLVIGKISTNTYLVLDPYNDLTWEITISGTKATYKKSGSTCSSTIDIGYQYYNSKALITPKAAQSISVSSVTKTYGANKTFTLRAKLTKGNGKLSYHSEDTSVATVSSGGVVTIKGIGKTKITVKATETMEYKPASKSVTIKIRPKTTKFTVCKNVTGQGISMTWEKRAGVAAYQIQYGTDAQFASAKKIKILPPKLTKTITGLEKNETYYVRIRTYKSVNGTNFCSTWSEPTVVSIKK